MGLPEPDRAGFVDVNRTRLRVWEWGDRAAPAVVCLHGAYDHGRMFDGLAPHLAGRGFRVLAPDLRGHGDSGRVGSGNTWMASALDVALLARHAGAPLGLVGHSMGGGQATFVAGVWPELVRWVVNLDGLGPPADRFEERDLAESASQGLQAVQRAMARPPRVYPSVEDMVERRRRINVRLPDEWIEHLVRHASRPTEGGYAWKFDPLFSVGLPGDFSHEHLLAEHELVSCPVLVLTGSEHDTWSDLGDEEIAGRLAGMPGARHHVIAGAGHYVHVEQPEAVFAEIDTFLTEVGA